MNHPKYKYDRKVIAEKLKAYRRFRHQFIVYFIGVVFAQGLLGRLHLHAYVELSILGGLMVGLGFFFLNDDCPLCGHPQKLMPHRYCHGCSIDFYKDPKDPTQDKK